MSPQGRKRAALMSSRDHSASLSSYQHYRKVRFGIESFIFLSDLKIYESVLIQDYINKILSKESSITTFFKFLSYTERKFQEFIMTISKISTLEIKQETTSKNITETTPETILESFIKYLLKFANIL